jgi:hypothetical protein
MGFPKWLSLKWMEGPHFLEQHTLATLGMPGWSADAREMGLAKTASY